MSEQQKNLPYVSLPKCAGCLNDIINDELLTCSFENCRMRYHLDFCIGGPILEESARDQWICPKCRCSMKKAGGSNCATPVRSLDSLDQLNITFRGKSKAALKPLETVETTNLAELLKEIRKPRADIIALRSDFCNLQKEIRGMSSLVQVCCERMDKVEDRVRTLEERVEAIEAAETKDITLLKSTIAYLENQLNDREQEAMLNDIDITGVQEDKGENPIHIVTLVAKKLDVALEE